MTHCFWSHSHMECMRSEVILKFTVNKFTGSTYFQFVIFASGLFVVFVLMCAPWFASGSKNLLSSWFLSLSIKYVFHQLNPSTLGSWLVNITSYFLILSHSFKKKKIQDIFWILHFEGIHFLWFCNMVVQNRFLLSVLTSNSFRCHFIEVRHWTCLS